MRDVGPGWSTGSMHRQIAGTLTGRITKWVVLGVVLVLTGFMGMYSTQLADVQNNEASSWLPGSAESTQVLDELSQSVDPNDIPTLVVFQRDGGLTDDDLAAMEADGEEIAQLDGVTDEGVLTPVAAEAAAAQGAPMPTLVSEDGEVAYLYFVLNFGTNGWNDIPAAADEIRDIATLDGGQVHLAGYGGQAADSAEAFEGIDTNLIMITLLVVVVLLLVTYRSAYLWLLPIFCAIVANTVADRTRLPAGQVRRPDRQRPEPGHLEHPGHRRRHRLRPAPRRPLSRGAPPSRGPARGDGVRPAPRRSGDLRQRCHRRRRDAVPARWPSSTPPPDSARSTPSGSASRSS